MSTSNSSSSKRRRYDEEDNNNEESTKSKTSPRIERERDSSSRKESSSSSSHRDKDRERGSDRDRDRDRDRRSGGSGRDGRDRDEHRSSNSNSRRHDSPKEDSSSRRSSTTTGNSSNSTNRRDRSRDRNNDRDRDSSRRDDRDNNSNSRNNEQHSPRRDRRDDNSSSISRRGGDSNSRKSDDTHRRSRTRSPDRRYSPAPNDSNPPTKKTSFNSTFSTSQAATAPSTPALTSIGSPLSAPGTPMSPSTSTAGSGTKTKEEEEKLRIKREKLELWKAKNAAKMASASPAPASPVVSSMSSPKITSTPTPAPIISIKGKGPASLPAKPVAAIASSSKLPPKPTFSTSLPVLGSSSSSDPASRALAAAAAIASRLTTVGMNNASIKPGLSSLPAKPSFSFNSTTTTTNNNNNNAAFKSSGLKNGTSMAMGGAEDEEDTKKIGFMSFDNDDDNDVDMNGNDEAMYDEEEDEEDLEGGVVFKAREGGRDANRGVDESMDVDSTASLTTNVPVVEEDEEEDELEMFMSGVQAQVKNVDNEDRAKLGGGTPLNTKGKISKNALVEPEAGEERPDAGSEDEVDKVGDSAADILALAAKKVVRRGRELTAVDHSKIKYEPFQKAFYHAPVEVELLTPEEVEEMRIEMDGIKVRGADPPKPAAKWSYCGLPAACIDVIKNLEYAAPTSIQAQAIPAIMSGRDIIGVAKTGSGKTIAFLLPMFRHIKDQRALKTMEGPIAMIMTPTRELATQIFKECKPFLKALGLRASCAYGGTPLKDNIADMKRGSELIVCTPGRMIELLTTNSGRIINLHRVTYLVLDEADRMFDMGFEPQVMKIINQIRPDRQTVLFSATFPRQMEALARKILSRPLEITVGGRSIVAPEIDQIVEVREEDTKFNRLLEYLGRLSNDDPDARALIFVERQDSADQLLQNLLKKNYSCMSLHGGMEQVDRDQTIADFKTGDIPIVIATSVAARGLDVKQLRLVIQYDAPNHMEDYVHRAGRTGRAGQKGTCVTFVTPEQDRYALDIFKALVASSATIPVELKELAEAFAEKVKAGKESVGSGFGGKGLERLDNDRDAQSRAERAAYGEVAIEKKPDDPVTGAPGTVADTSTVAEDVADLEIEIKRGPAPDIGRKTNGSATSGPAVVNDAAATAIATAAIKAAEEAAIAAGKPVGAAKAQTVIAMYNVMLKAKTAARSNEVDNSTDSARRRDPDATDYHAIIYINDYPQKARWKVTNKETMVQLVETTGASITNKGVFYEPGKEPGPDELPKLHLLIESNDEFRVKHAISEIKRSLIEGAVMAAEADQRNPGQAAGRYTV